MTRAAKWSLMVALGALGACGGGAPAGPVQVPAELAGPVESTDVAAGETAFQQVCASCHAGGGAPDLTGLAAEPGKVRTMVRHGYGEMPAVTSAHLDDADLEHVLAYLQSVGGVRQPPAPGEPEPVAPDVETAGDAAEEEAAEEAEALDEEGAEGADVGTEEAEAAEGR